MQNTINRRISFYWVCSVLFLISGFSGLVYEVIWFKRFAHVWGNSILAIAAVVTSFLFGLGIGARVIGRLADRSAKPLFWYGIFECLIGILAFIIPFEIHWLYRVSSILYPTLQNYPVFHYLIRFAFTFLVIGPPCILMGGTLPLLIKQFTPRSTSLKATTGWFYAINTIGAAFGCYLTGFHLLPSIGLYWSNTLAVFLNLAVGVVTIVITRHFKTNVSPQHNLSSEPENFEPIIVNTSIMPCSARNLYTTVAITGFASLILQMIWVRQLSLILGGSTYAFTAVLFVFLIGISVGSLCFHIWLRKLSNLVYAPMYVILGIIISTAIGYFLIPHLTYIIGLIQPLRSSQIFNAAASIAVSSVLQFLPVFGMGLLFPIFVHLTRMQSENAGKAVGNIYAWNTLGTIIGASVTCTLLIPYLGILSTIRLAIILYFSALIIQLPENANRRILSQILPATLAFGLILFIMKPNDPMVTNSGMYLYGYSPPEKLKSTHKTLYFSEGASCNVLVLESDKHRSLRINGKVDASNGEDMSMQLGLAYFPRFLLPNAQRVLNIGFGSGTTAGASLLFPDTEVICCEIEPEVFAASKYFSAVNHKPEDSPYFTMIYDDGRSYLQGTNEKYDLILSEPSNPWISGVSNLFTKEFYEISKSKLNKHGILAQWIQLYALTTSEYALVVRTLLSVFPHCALVYISGGDTFLLASTSPLSMTEETLHEAQLLVDEQNEIQADLKKYFGTDRVATLLLHRLILGKEGLSRLADINSSQIVNTDTNMRLEYAAPLHLFDDSRAHSLTTLLQATDAEWFINTFRKSGCSGDHIDAICNLVNLLTENNMKQLALKITEFGLEVAPDEVRLLAKKQILDSSQSTESTKDSFAEIMSYSAKEVNRAGVALWQSERYDDAVLAFEELLSNYPDSASSWANLAVNYQSLGQIEKAEQAFKKALSLDPFNSFAIRSYDTFVKEHDHDINHKEKNKLR